MFSLNPASTLFFFFFRFCFLILPFIQGRSMCVYLSFPSLFTASLVLDFLRFLILYPCLSLYSNPICHLKGNYCFLLKTLLTPDVWGCFTPASSLDTNWVSCSSVLTLTTWGEHRPCELRAWSHRLPPLQAPDASRRLSPVLLLTNQL